jgi:hypothetical protein
MYHTYKPLYFPIHDSTRSPALLSGEKDNITDYELSKRKNASDGISSKSDGGPQSA